MEIVRVLDEEQSKGLYETTYETRVIRAIKSNEETVKIGMMGKTIGKEKIEAEIDPLMTVGDKWLIFARLNRNGTYTILGGPYGRYLYNEKTNTVTSYYIKNKNGEEVLSSLGLKIKSMSFSEIEKMILSYIKAN